MLAHSHTKARRRGIGTVLATIVFVFIMIFTTGNLLVWSIIQASNYQIVADQMRDADFNRQTESLRITDVIFGGSNAFTLGTSNSSTSTTASDWPIQNMNLTSSSGWTFKKIMPSGVSVGFSGGFDEQGVGPGAIGSPSGPGVLFMGESFNKSAVTFKGNWSYSFYVDPSRYTGSGYIPTTASVVASWAHVVPASLWSPAIENINLRLILVNQSGKNFVIDAGSYIEIADADISWNYTNGIRVTGGGGAVTRDFWGKVGQPQWITLIISVTLNIKLGAVTTESRIYFDDVGIEFDYPATLRITDYPFTLTGVNRALIIRMDPSYASSYSIANVHQLLYIFDYDLNKWTTISDVFVSQTTVNVTIPVTGTSIPRFVSSNDQAKIRVYSASVNSFTVTSSSVSLRYFFSDANKFSVILTNTGSLTSHAVSLWIIDSNGHTNFNSTTSTKFNVFVPPGSSISATLSFTWARGQNTLRVITERGNVVTFQTNA